MTHNDTTKKNKIITNIYCICTITFAICFISCVLLVLSSAVLPHDLVSKLLHIGFYCTMLSGFVLIAIHWKD